MNENQGQCCSKVWLRRVYCRYEGENSQRHLEESRLSQATRGEGEEREKGAKRGCRDQETRRVATWLFYSEEILAEAQPLGGEV